MDIKAIVSNVASKAEGLARTAVKKGSEVAESAKLTITLKSEERKLENMFSTLGKLFYEQVKGTDVRAQIKAQVMEIDEQKLVIQELKASIDETNGKIKCDSCGKDMDIDAAYCPTCGKAQAMKKGDCKAAPASEEQSAVKPLSADDFVEFFKSTTEKYFTK